MTKTLDQHEKDINKVINFLKQTDPTKATRKHALEMLGNMQSLAHLIAHKVVNDEKKGKIKKVKKTPSRPN